MIKKEYNEMKSKLIKQKKRRLMLEREVGEAKGKFDYLNKANGHLGL